MIVLDRAARRGLFGREERRWRAGKMYGSGWREWDIMDQKRDETSMVGIGGSWAEGGEDCGWTDGEIFEVGISPVAVEDWVVAVPRSPFWDETTTASASRLTGSTIVVSWATLDNSGFST